MGNIAYLEPKWTIQLLFLIFYCGIISISEQAKLLPQSIGLQTIFEWKQLEFKYPTEAERKKDIEKKIFIPGIPAIIDVDIAFPDDEKKKTFFVTMPRFQPGIPITFGRITKQEINGNRIIEPYPSWNWHRNPSKCSSERLVSVYRTQIDSCGRLWVLDSGYYPDTLICPPQVIAFDLRNDQVVHKYEIPQNILQSNSLPVTIMVDVNDGCQNTFVYIADNQGFAILVYDVSKRISWRIQDKSMYPNPDWGTYTIMGESFDLMDGILGMALTHPKHYPRKLFFHAMSSNTESVVKISDIRNRERFAENPNSSPEIFHTYKGRRKSQSPAEVIDKDGILYFGDVNEVTLKCWDTSTEYGPRHIRTLSNNKTILQFTSGMKVVNTSNKTQELYVVTSRFQKVFLGTINVKETNFRILKLGLNHFTKRKCI